MSMFYMHKNSMEISEGKTFGCLAEGKKSMETLERTVSLGMEQGLDWTGRKEWQETEI